MIFQFSVIYNKGSDNKTLLINEQEGLNYKNSLATRIVKMKFAHDKNKREFTLLHVTYDNI